MIDQHKNHKLKKTLFDEAYKKICQEEQAFLDKEDDEHKVRQLLNKIEADVSPAVGVFVSLILYPNIPILKKFIEKWKETPIHEGKKWIVFLSSDTSISFTYDLDAYNDAFSIFRLCDKTYSLYEKSFKDNDITIDYYQYPSYYKSPDENNMKVEVSSNGDPDRVIFSWKDASCPPEEIEEPIVCCTTNNKILTFKETIKRYSLNDNIVVESSWEWIKEKYNIKKWVYQRDLISK